MSLWRLTSRFTSVFRDGRLGVQTRTVSNTSVPLIVFKRLSDWLSSTVSTVKLLMLIMDMHNHRGGDVLTDWKCTEQWIPVQLQRKQQSSSLTALSNCSVYYSYCWGRTHFNSAATNARSLEQELLPPRTTLIWICLSVFLIIVQEYGVLLRAQFPFQKFFSFFFCKM